MVKTQKVDLQTPVTVNGIQVSALHIRTPKVVDQFTAVRGGGSREEQEIRLFANLCEVAPETIYDLDLADYVKLQGVLAGFLS